MTMTCLMMTMMMARRSMSGGDAGARVRQRCAPRQPAHEDASNETPFSVSVGCVARCEACQGGRDRWEVRGEGRGRGMAETKDATARVGGACATMTLAFNRTQPAPLPPPIQYTHILRHLPSGSRTSPSHLTLPGGGGDATPSTNHISGHCNGVAPCRMPSLPSSAA